MPTLLFMMLPEKGHLNSSLKISRALQARGHRVFHTTLSDFEDYILSQGLGFIPLFPLVAPKGFILSQCVNVSVFEALTAALYFTGLKENKTAHKCLEEEVERIRHEVRPDLIVLDSYLALRIARLVSSSNDNWILLNPTARFPLDTNIPEHNAPVFERLYELPTLCLCPVEFDLPGNKPVSHHYYVEASVDLQRKENDFAWDWIDNKKQLIYCSLGTQSHWSFDSGANDHNQNVRLRLLQQVVRAVARRPDWQLILSSESQAPAKDFGAMPPNVLLVSYAPQLEILKRTSVVITHGGLNSIKECILLDVPMIVFPMKGDQIGNAARVTYHRLGVSGRLELATAASIQAMIEKINSNPIYRSNLARMSQIFKSKEAAEPSVALIEAHITPQVTAASEIIVSGGNIKQ